MARQARSQFAILGMLTLQPMTGYDLRQKIQTTVGHFWQESFGQLYPTLAKLEEQGLVLGKEDAQGERKRIVYHITKKGRFSLNEWLEVSPAPHIERNELLMKLFFAPEVGAATAIRHITDSRADASTRLKDVQGMSLLLANELAQHPAYDYYWATLRYGELGLKTHLKWCDEVLARLQA